MNHNFEGKILAFWINAQFYIFFLRMNLRVVLWNTFVQRIVILC